MTDAEKVISVLTRDHRKGMGEIIGLVKAKWPNDSEVKIANALLELGKTGKIEQYSFYRFRKPK